VPACHVFAAVWPDLVEVIGMAGVMIGVDPHEGSHTAVAVDERDRVSTEDEVPTYRHIDPYAGEWTWSPTAAFFPDMA
jgi:hypothetical protein